jgi:uncharacterized protein DUF4494
MFTIEIKASRDGNREKKESYLLGAETTAEAEIKIHKYLGGYSNLDFKIDKIAVSSVVEIINEFEEESKLNPYLVRIGLVIMDEETEQTKTSGHFYAIGHAENIKLMYDIAEKKYMDGENINEYYINSITQSNLMLLSAIDLGEEEAIIKDENTVSFDDVKEEVKEENNLDIEETLDKAKEVISNQASSEETHFDDQDNHTNEEKDDTTSEKETDTAK